MILSLSAQANLFFATVVAGAVIGFIYDALRIFRRIVPHKGIFVQAEDALYWICVIFFMFYVLMVKNSGEIRFFTVYGAFLGMLLYFLIASPAVHAVSDRVIAVVRYIVCLFITILLTPFRLLYLPLRGPVKKTRYFIKSRAKKMLHLCKLYVKMNKKAIARNRRILFRKK